MRRLTAFEPVVSEDPRILILGSMPGVESLNQGRYYAHPRNSFWKILYEIFGEVSSEDYEDRCMLIRRHQLALWDVLHACRREGSLDSAIEAEEINDFSEFFRDHPLIHTVIFNGGKAWELFRRHHGFDTGRIYLKLPSTSPAYTLTYEKKLSAWTEALNGRLYSAQYPDACGNTCIEPAMLHKNDMTQSSPERMT